MAPSRGIRRLFAAGLAGLTAKARSPLFLVMVILVACGLGLGFGLGSGSSPGTGTVAQAVPTMQGAQTAQSASTTPATPAAPTSLPTSTPQAADSDSTVDVDVLVLSTQTSGLAAVRELAVGAPHLRVALISAGNWLETPLAQGLGVEDAHHVALVKGGFYDEWRETVITRYAQRGIRPFNADGRFVYAPDVSAEVLWGFISGPKAPNVLFYSGRLLAASDAGGRCTAEIQLEGGAQVRFNTRYFIDASVEGDLARMLGADYRVGRQEKVYNDVLGDIPEYPGAGNGFQTAPQRYSALLTLEVYNKGAAPRLADLAHPDYDPATYDRPDAYPSVRLGQDKIDAFRNSWTMTRAVLPDAKRELNETWNDWPDVGLSYLWVFRPEARGDLRRQVVEWAINRVRYLQEHGYPKVGIADIPQYLYVREGPRVVGLDTYTVDELRSRVKRQTVAVGCYAEYDRHDTFYPNVVDRTGWAYVPMGALMAAGHPALLVSTAVSTDYQTYSSPVRMEHTRAGMGGAAGAIVVLADRLMLSPNRVPYEEVRRLLLARDYVVPDSEGALVSNRWGDISNRQWKEWYGVTASQVAKVAEGFEQSLFKPTKLITRIQFSKMAMDGFNLEKVFPDTPTFPVDVPPTHYYYGWVEGAVEVKLVAGNGDGTFGPDIEISRQQANTILGRYLAQQELAASGHIRGERGTYPSLEAWYEAEGHAVLAPFADRYQLSPGHCPQTACLIYHQVIKGRQTGGGLLLDPRATVTRAQAAVMVVRAGEGPSG